MTKSIKRRRNQYRYDSLLYLQEQLELGFDPKWLITYHYFTPEEVLKVLRETENDHGFRNRYGSKNLWNQVARDKWIKRRREELDWIIKDTSQIKNLELKHIYGVSRLNNLDKYSIPPMLFFHELGKVNLQFHTHQLMSQVPEEFKQLADDFSKNGFITTSLDNLINFSPKSLSFSHCLLSSSMTQSFELITLRDW